MKRAMVCVVMASNAVAPDFGSIVLYGFAKIAMWLLCGLFLLVRLLGGFECWWVVCGVFVVGCLGGVCRLQSCCRVSGFIGHYGG